ncbi:ATP-dependent DNA helicase sgs1 [Puccinia graminis f. sp. tritici]|uniref:DNA 3'-5' helicase n=1 Tax=Puccinia graminis f. sp. tritici TaxID=56615 RepID=A0A5B0LVB7_PUCGR|nr:ATP-dependent DNA helicase sgs1 [Puccinia graminis f. sp. tritici]KAA1093439.1 ATP-dependent DNA helicase sgs1 [Puccinia graminis f. sp. tritici]
MIKPHSSRRPKLTSITRKAKRPTFTERLKQPTTPRRPKTNSTRQRIWTPTGINIYQEVYKMTDKKLKDHISQASLKSYGQHAKDLQVDAVFNLVQGRNTFLLAGTGFGKSRIAELYMKMIPQKSKGVVLVLNPLDSLGENQVLEKQQAGFSAINLTKLSFNRKTAEEISDGVYQFVYLSPEIFLNSKLFRKVYYSSVFQNRLALIVVDEAHMIYIWGLLLFRNDKPLLLLSATCRPVAVEAIKKSLKLTDATVDILRGELTRPEIRILRLPMANSLASSLDAIKVFPSFKDVADHDMVPSLVYSGSRNRTSTVLEVIERARETPGSASIPDSNCARRFHSCTGDEDKVTCVEDFATGRFPVISCTMALGLGQNWKRVRMVTHIGRGDPASICQMIGRCGRDGKNGLAVLFVEKTCRNGKNTIDRFTRGAPQTDLDRMDALAITTLCLRVAFSLDNLVGYIPLWEDDPAYVAEVAREKKVGMPTCRCSNCSPTKSASVIEALSVANNENFDEILNDNFLLSNIYNIKHKYPQRTATIKKRKFTEDDAPEIDQFATELMTDFNNHYNTNVRPGGSTQGSDIFDKDDCQAILAQLDTLTDSVQLKQIIGGDCFVGQSSWLFDWVTNYKSKQLRNQPTKDVVRIAKKPKAPLAAVPSLIGPTSAAANQVPRKPTKKALAAQEAQRKALERQEAKKRKI